MKNVGTLLITSNVKNCYFLAAHCAHQCAQTQSDNHHPAPNANQVLKPGSYRLLVQNWAGLPGMSVNLVATFSNSANVPPTFNASHNLLEAMARARL